jgi:hypothetical protein
MLTSDGLGQAVSEIKGRELLGGLVWLVLADEACAKGKATLSKAGVLVVA